jgi:hypothetical protein
VYIKGWAVSITPSATLTVSNASKCVIATNRGDVHLYGPLFVLGTASFIITTVGSMYEVPGAVYVGDQIKIDGDATFISTSLQFRKLGKTSPSLLLSIKQNSSMNASGEIIFSYTFGNIHVDNINWGEGVLLLDVPRDLPNGYYPILSTRSRYISLS